MRTLRTSFFWSQFVDLIRRNGLDRFWRIAKVKEKYRERKRRRERQHLANEKFYASTRTKKPAGTSLPSQLVASRSEISPLLDSRCCFLHTGAVVGQNSRPFRDTDPSTIDPLTPAWYFQDTLLFPFDDRSLAFRMILIV
ncbi:uncharacterized protein LOC117213493 [Bombus bifarius]|uniref:Uncharacterized protein LOC117213493 n=1 Tax=Bombus bifarius TaxID=103933 RepID=A0A6P8NJU0_9HYME|nr:uncharacterized protein LOC117154731 [Bombus vancouverensis nearcticus]XP_033314762.1 uncharacterized protein LOC117213493 [Bombus bifarius]